MATGVDLEIEAPELTEFLDTWAFDFLTRRFYAH